MLSAAVLLFLFAIAASAQGTFVYTNNGNTTANTVSGFSLSASGQLTLIAGSPFSTGGAGGGGFFGSNRIAIATVSKFLYAANEGSGNVSGFSINPATGFLTAVPGSPFSATGASSGGYSLAVSPNNKFLFCANSNTGAISAFSINANGSLSAAPGSPFLSNTGVVGIKVAPNAKFLATALPGKGPNGSVGMWSIGNNGALTPVPGSPFAGAVSGSGAAIQGIDINSASTLMFAPFFSSGTTQIDVFSIGSNGALAPIQGSPFTFAGLESTIPLLSPNGKFLFVSDQSGDDNMGDITVFNVAPSGSLTQVAGSPFVNTSGFFPAGMGTDGAGQFLFAANDLDTVSVFSVASNGALTPAPGSPFFAGDGAQSVLQSLAILSGTPFFNTCMRDNVTGDVFAFNSVTGAYEYTRCKDGFTLTGFGTVTEVDGVLTLTDNESTRKITASFNTGSLTGAATITFEVATGVWETDYIHDTTSQGTGCSCGS